MDVHFTEIAQKAAVDQRTHVGVAGQAVGTGDDHGRQTRRFERPVEHALGFAGVQGHAGLGQHVLARVEGRQRDRAMQVGPGPDHDRVDFGIGDQVFPVAIHLGNVELTGEPRRRFAAAVADRRRCERRGSPETRACAASG